MSGPRWINAGVAIDVHGAQLAIFGGPDGVREFGLLELVLGRSRTECGNGERDVAALAAAYAFGIARNHPFVDGNKRAAFACMMLFLRLNGQRFAPPPAEATAAILALAAGELEADDVADWIRRGL